MSGLKRRIEALGDDYDGSNRGVADANLVAGIGATGVAPAAAAAATGDPEERDYKKFVYTMNTNLWDIPDDIELIEFEMGVTVIPYEAFKENQHIKIVTISSSVKVVGQYAFYACKSLVSVTFLSATTNNGPSAGDGDGKIVGKLKSSCEEEDDDDGKLTKIDNGAFLGCTNLKEVVLPHQKRYKYSVGVESFKHCFKLSNIVLPEGLKIIGRYAFENCNNLTEVVLHTKGLRTIQRGPFYNCPILQSIKFKGSLDHGATLSLSRDVFVGLPNLKSISFPPPRNKRRVVTSVKNNGNEECTHHHGDCPLFSFRSISLAGETMQDDPIKISFKTPIGIDVPNELPIRSFEDFNNPNTRPPKQLMNLYDDFHLYRSLCRGNANKLVTIQSIRLVSKQIPLSTYYGPQNPLCGFQVTYRFTDSSSNKTVATREGPTHPASSTSSQQRQQQQQEDSGSDEGDGNGNITSTTIRFESDEHLMGLHVFNDFLPEVTDLSTIVSKIQGITFVTSKRQIHWGKRNGYVEALMFRRNIINNDDDDDDDDDPILELSSCQSHIVALSASYDETVGCITGIGCYSRRFNWFRNTNVKTCIMVRAHWLRKEQQKLKVGDEEESDGDENMIVKLVKQEDVFKTVIKFL